jgi:glutamyl aminopeptidase
MNYYEDLMRLEATSGDELEVISYVEKVISGMKNYTIKRDRLGSIFAFKKGTSNYHVMVAGHMDEVGMMVTSITSLGMLKLQPIGGLDPKILLANTYHIHTASKVLLGYIGAIPPHLNTAQQLSFDEILLDIGATSKEEAISMGVELGNRVTFIPIYEPLTKHRVLAKSVDNRYGVALALDMMTKFHDIELPFDVSFGATVQEEVGLRGAETIVNTLKPDVFIALDASPVNDISDASDIALGKGFLLRMYDPRNTMPMYLKESLSQLATKHQIPFQYYISKGGTDAAQTLDMFKGIISTTIGLPARYIHSPAAIYDLRDIDSCTTMLETVLKSLNEDVIKAYQKGIAYEF